MSAQSETQRALQERKERLLELMGAKAVGVDGGLTPEEIYDVARAEETKSKTVEALLDEACTHVGSAARRLWRDDAPEGSPDAPPSVIAEGRCNLQSLEKWLQMTERQLLRLVRGLSNFLAVVIGVGSFLPFRR